MTYLNDITEKQHARILEKYIAKKEKIKRERWEATFAFDEMEEKYQKQIQRLKHVIKKQHEKFDNFKALSDIELRTKQGISDCLDRKINSYKETAKQAKAVLRIPRLCHVYHQKVKHLTDDE